MSLFTEGTTNIYTHQIYGTRHNNSIVTQTIGPDINILISDIITAHETIIRMYQLQNRQL